MFVALKKLRCELYRYKFRQKFKRTVEGSIQGMMYSFLVCSSNKSRNRQREELV